MTTARAHLQRLWPKGAFWPIAPFVAYALYSAARRDLRAEHVLVVLFAAGMAYATPRTKQIFVGLYPFGLVGLLFDGMRPFQKLGLTESRVLLCELRAVEATLFGSGGRTVHDWFQVHHAPAVDLFAAIPYATFILWCVAGCVYLYTKDRAAMRRFGWAFLVLNASAFVTYHILPAAPPWYFHARGCVVDLSTAASEGPALARVDALLGIGYFHGMYGKASSVFGALPSLHCAYPFLLVLAGWRAFGPKLRAASVAYFLAMVFSAMYLDHHWLLDALLGCAFAAASLGAVKLVSEWRREPAPAAVAEGS